MTGTGPPRAHSAAAHENGHRPPIRPGMLTLNDANPPPSAQKERRGIIRRNSRHCLDIQGQGGQVQALTRRRTIQPSRPLSAGAHYRGTRRETTPEILLPRQLSSSWLINGETTTIVTGAVTGHRIRDRHAIIGASGTHPGP